MKKILIASFCAIGGMLSAQSVKNAFLDWTTTGGTQYGFYKNMVKTDGAKNVYVVGATVAANGLTDIYVSKTNASGVLQWVRQVDGLAHATDFATDMYIDASNNLYVTGVVTNDSVNHYTDLICIKYNSSGTQQFKISWDGGHGNDGGSDIKATATGSFVVTGSTTNSSSNTDIVTQFYNTTGGLVWSSVYDSGQNDAGIRLSTSASLVNIAGIVQTSSTNYRGAVVSYSISNGAQQSFTTTSATSTGVDQVTCMETDPNGNIYIGGAKTISGHGYDGWLIKLTSSLSIVFDHTYEGGSNLDDVIEGVDFDNSGNAYATGYKTTSTHGTDFWTMKCNTTTGDTTWTKSYDDPSHGNDGGADIQLDVNTDIYVTGFAKSVSTGLDYYTMKYPNAGGSPVWSVSLDGAGFDDKATALALDTNNNVIITGTSKLFDNSYQYLTAKYVQKDFITPVDFNSEAPKNSDLYYPNRGQIINQAGGVATDVLFTTMDIYPFTFFKSNSFHYKLINFDTLSTVSDTLQRIDVTMIGSKGNSTGVGTEPFGGKLSIFDTQLPANVLDIQGYRRFVVTDVYPNIDAQYYSNGLGQKIYYVVKPGGNPNNIKWKIDGANSTTIVANQLKIQGINASITYAPPITYQLNGSGGIVALAGTPSWQNAGTNTYSLSIPSYTNTLALVIEVNYGNYSPTAPTSILNFDFCTYYGGALDEGIRSMKFNPVTAHFAAIGTTLSWDQFKFPTLQGSALTTNVCSSCGAYYLTAVLFDTVGRRLATNIYGTGVNIDPQEAVLDNHDRLTIIGNTGATTLPSPGTQTSPGTYSNSNGKGFAVQFQKNGASLSTIKWQTRLNGYASDIAIHPVTKNIYITSSIDPSVLSIDLKIKSNAYNCAGTPSGWNFQISEFDSTGVRKWATLFPSPNPNYSVANGNFMTGFPGFSGDPYLKCRIDCDKYGFVLAGEVHNTGLLIWNKYHKNIDSTYNGNADAFAARFDNKDSIVYSQYIGGTGDDGYFDVKVTKDNEVSMVGYSKSQEYHDLTFRGNASQYVDTTYSTTYAKMLISKMDTTGSKLWSTYYGTGTDDCYGWTLTNDADGKLYVSGGTAPTGFNTAYSNPSSYYGYSANRGGTSDIFMLGFTPWNNVFWDIYFGGVLQDFASTLTYNSVTNKLMIAGGTNSPGAGYGSHPTYFPLWYVSYDPTVWFDGQINSSGIQGYNTYVGPADGFYGWFSLPRVTGIENFASIYHANDAIAVFPNPTNGSSNLLFKSALKGKTKIEIYNAIGQLVYATLKDNITENSLLVLPTESYDGGIYFVNVLNNELSTSIKIIVNK